MKVVVSVVVYNRVHNVKRWLYCWTHSESQCDRTLVIIDNSRSQVIRDLCAGIAVYVPRENTGYDIGAFQDVCRDRLEGFPKDYDYLLWCVDDTLPMRKDFIDPFITPLLSQSMTGISCMKISASVQPHVRTTGFCVSRETLSKLQFPSDPVKTKAECYLFEHRGKDTLTNQIRKMSLSCVQVAPDAVAPLWDSGYHKRLNRMREHEEAFSIEKNSTDEIVFICTVYNTYPQIISSLLLQTYKNWKLILIHDGPCAKWIRDLIPNDDRINFVETEKRINNWGHGLRQMALKEYDLGSHVVITNADNYYVPTFIEYMLKGFEKSHTAVATYCSKMTHSYKAWDVIDCKLARGYLDCGGVMVKSEIAKEIGWSDVSTHSADWTYFSDIASRYSWSNFIQVKGNLFVHN